MNFKIKKNLGSNPEIQREKRVEKNFKKNFGGEQPTPSTCAKGGGCTSQNIPHIYSAGKYPVLAICVRTQIDFYLKGGITTPPNNKTRLKRFICVHNGHHTEKRNKCK